MWTIGMDVTDENLLCLLYYIGNSNTRDSFAGGDFLKCEELLIKY